MDCLKIFIEKNSEHLISRIGDRSFVIGPETIVKMFEERDSKSLKLYGHIAKAVLEKY